MDRAIAWVGGQVRALEELLYAIVGIGRPNTESALTHEVDKADLLGIAGLGVEVTSQLQEDAGKPNRVPIVRNVVRRQELVEELTQGQLAPRVNLHRGTSWIARVVVHRVSDGESPNQLAV